jgi:D-alanine-D-alanine ligase-like ATP-grasp enzyme
MDKPVVVVLFGGRSSEHSISSATAGGFSGTTTLTATNEARLLAGTLYINVHTSTNGGGEIRGNLVAVPEPSRVLLAAIEGVLIGFQNKG